MSYAEISRQASADTDGFSVKVNNGHKFKVLNDSSKPATCKTWFGDCLKEVAASSTIQKVFRFRYDRVNACSKIQKPYCILKHPLSLKVGHPVKAYFWSNQLHFKASLRIIIISTSKDTPACSNLTEISNCSLQVC